jgi:hypothetical protein
MILVIVTLTFEFSSRESVAANGSGSIEPTSPLLPTSSGTWTSGKSLLAWVGPPSMLSVSPPLAVVGVGSLAAAADSVGVGSESAGCVSVGTAGCVDPAGDELPEVDAALATVTVGALPDDDVSSSSSSPPPQATNMTAIRTILAIRRMISPVSLIAM